jgi:glutathione synthase/RimK-type ligase-like ATP-grasp enzyme
LKDLCEKTSRILNMHICGLDLVLHERQWYILEANGCPGLKWIDKDFPRLTKKLAAYLVTLCREK